MMVECVKETGSSILFLSDLKNYLKINFDNNLAHSIFRDPVRILDFAVLQIHYWQISSYTLLNNTNILKKRVGEFVCL